MSWDPGATSTRRAATAVAASATVGVAVAADTVASEHPLHTATLGAVALVVGLLRLRLAGRHSGVFAAISGAIVAQPALHSVVTLLPAERYAPAGPGPGHAAAQATLSAVHVLVAALIVTAVCGAEQLFLRAAALQPLARWLWLLNWAPERPQPSSPAGPLPAPPPTHRSCVANLPPRGPPVAVRAATV